MLPMVCSTTPSAPHFGHLFVGWVGAGTWIGMAVHSIRAARPAPRSSPIMGVMEGTAYIRWDFSHADRDLPLRRRKRRVTAKAPLPDELQLLDLQAVRCPLGVLQADLDSSRLRIGGDVELLMGSQEHPLRPLQHVWMRDSL